MKNTSPPVAEASRNADSSGDSPEETNATHPPVETLNPTVIPEHTAVEPAGTPTSPTHTHPSFRSPPAPPTSHAHQKTPGHYQTHNATDNAPYPTQTVSTPAPAPRATTKLPRSDHHPQPAYFPSLAVFAADWSCARGVTRHAQHPPRPRVIHIHLLIRMPATRITRVIPRQPQFRHKHQPLPVRRNLRSLNSSILSGSSRLPSQGNQPRKGPPPAV